MPSRSADPDADESVRRRTLRRAGDWLERASPLTRDRSSSGADRGQFLSRDHDGRSYELFVPEGYDPDEPVPLVVMLHGCRQTAAGFAAETGMNEVAADERFLVAYPQQSRFENPMRCWRWYDDAHATRGSGELASIAGVTRAVAEAFAVDTDRIYVGGLSAGGAMAAQAIVEYPDLYAAAGVHAGLGYDAADGVLSALVRMRTGGFGSRDADRASSGPLDADPGAIRAADGPDRLPTMVVHGTDDGVVDVANARQLTDQAVRANGLGVGGGSATSPPEPDRETTGSTGAFDYVQRRYRDGTGRVVVEEVLVEGMGHGWSGGAPGGDYTVPGGPDASRLLWHFFDRHRLSAPVGGPVVDLPIVGDVDLWPLRRRLDRGRRRLRRPCVDWSARNGGQLRTE